MGGQEKRQTISTQRANLLAAMGVQVWYARPTQASNAAPVPLEASAPEQPSVPAAAVEQSARADAPTAPPADAPDTKGHQPAAAAAPAQVIEFIWLKGAAGMLWLPLTIDPATQQLAKDAVAFADWARQQPAGRVTQGDFRWPQLLDSNGTPERSLKVFIDKHLPGEGGWLAVDAEVLEQVEAWLGKLEVRWLSLPRLQGRADDVETKKKLWQSLKQSN